MLETAIQENTAAIRELIATIARGLPASAAQVAAVVAQAPQKTKQAQATVANNGASSTQEVTSSAPADAAAPEPSAAPAAPQPAAEASVSYDQVKTSILDLAKTKGRDAAMSLLAEFSAAKGTDLKPDQFAPFLAKATTLLAA